MAGATQPVTDGTFATEVLQSDKPVLVDFWAEWCGPCKMVAPVLEEIAAAHGDKLRIVKLNVDENPQTARNYQIMSIPTMHVFVNGAIADTIVGAKPKSQLLKALDSYIS
jgi:thioredoxin 1